MEVIERIASCAMTYICVTASNIVIVFLIAIWIAFKDDKNRKEK